MTNNFPILDNSAAKLFRFCPDAYKERYINGIEKKRLIDYFGFGTRIHKLLEEHYLRMKGETPVPSQPAPDDIELEAQSMFADYCAYYPVESFTVVDVERTFEVEVSPGLRLRGKIDLTQRDLDGKLGIIDHKSEKRGGKSNLPQAWAARDQVSLYKKAAEILYNEPVHYIVVNVLTKASPKGQEPPSFRRDVLQRTEEQVEKAVKDLRYVAGEIVGLIDSEQESWPQNRENCHNGYYACEYFELHNYGATPEILSLYKGTTPYLDL